jgi:hypothetical protein
LRLRNDNQRSVAARVRDKREPDAGISGSALDHQPAGLELAASLRLQDHLPRRAVLHRLTRVHEFGLAQNRASGLFGRALEHD